MFTLKIHTDNSAFYGDDGRAWAGPEVARILRAAADVIEGADARDSGTLRDVNGNTVGEYSLTPRRRKGE